MTFSGRHKPCSVRGVRTEGLGGERQMAAGGDQPEPVVQGSRHRVLRGREQRRLAAGRFERLVTTPRTGPSLTGKVVEHIHALMRPDERRSELARHGAVFRIRDYWPIGAVDGFRIS